MLHPDLAYLRDRMLTEQVLAVRAASPSARAVHAELAERYRKQVQVWRRCRLAGRPISAE